MVLKFLKLGFTKPAAYRGEVSSSAAAAAAGLGLGLALIVAIGAQNAFVLRQGLLGEHVAAVVAVCVGSDVVLIAAGVAGAGAALAALPSLITVDPHRRRDGPARLRPARGTARDPPAGARTLRPEDAAAARRGLAPRSLTLPRVHLAQPARLPRHGGAARRLGRRRPRRAALVVRRRRGRREHAVVLRARRGARLHCAALRPARRLACPRRRHRVVMAAVAAGLILG